MIEYLNSQWIVALTSVITIIGAFFAIWSNLPKIYRKIAHREYWETTFFEEGQKRREELTTFSIGKLFFADSICKFREQDGSIVTYRYRFNGVNVEGMLSGHFEGIDNAGRKNTDRGSFMMQYFHQSSRYVGKYLILSDSNEIISVDYNWNQKD